MWPLHCPCLGNGHVALFKTSGLLLWYFRNELLRGSCVPLLGILQELGFPPTGSSISVPASNVAIHWEGSEDHLGLGLTLEGFVDGASHKESTCQCRRCKKWEFDPWVRKIPWKRAWQPTPVFLPGEFHGQRTLVDYSPRSCKESDMSEQMNTHTPTHTHTHKHFGTTPPPQLPQSTIICTQNTVQVLINIFHGCSLVC